MSDTRARRLEREAEMDPLAADVALAVRDRGREVLLPAPVLGCPTCSGPLGCGAFGIGLTTRVSAAARCTRSGATA